VTARRAGVLVAFLASLAGFPCGCEKKEPEGVRFEDRSREAGIDFRHTDGSSGRYFIAETLASGVGLFDYDGDGDLDLYLVNGRPLPAGAPPADWAKDCTRGNALYRNDGAAPGAVPRFTDVTRQAGVEGTGFGVACCAGDYDGDGDLDLFVAQLEADVLYRNDGGSFRDVTAEAGVGDPAMGGGAAFGDYDRDGWLDLYVANYCREDYSEAARPPCTTNNVVHYCAPSTYPPVPDSLFRNRGNGTFEDASVSSGIRTPPPGRGMGVRFSDLDDDGYPDLYVANDGSANFLFQNLRNGAFQEIGLESGVAFDKHGDEQGSMGVDIADYDGDGRFDIFVTNYQKQTNAFYHNDGPAPGAGSEPGAGFPIFRDLVDSTRIGATSLPLVKWGTRFFDYDQDGTLDLFVANGHLEDRIALYDESSTYLQRNQLFRGTGGGVFREVTAEAGPGLAVLRSSRGAAFGDIDGDGDVDVAVLCSRDRPLLLMNEGRGHGGWIGLELRGKKPNLFAIGARAILRAGGRTWLDEVRSGGSYASQNSLRLHFGLGQTRTIDSLEVRWPDGTKESISGAVPGRVNRIEEGSGRAVEAKKAADGTARAPAKNAN
jgi:hypothetical protein